MAVIVAEQPAGATGNSAAGRKYPRESLAVFVVPITSGIAEDVVVLLSST